MRLAFVCTGNICRSPLAQVLASHHLANAGLSDRVELESFGTHDYHVGESADPRTIATALRFGIDLRAHRARRIEPDDCLRADLLLAMDADHERHLRGLAPAAVQDRIQRYLPWLEMDAHDVPDPYYGDSDGFVAVHRLLDTAAQRLTERLRAVLTDGHG